MLASRLIDQPLRYGRGHRLIILSPHKLTMTTRWPYCVQDRHAGKVTIYGWSTSMLAAPWSELK